MSNYGLIDSKAQSSGGRVGEAPSLGSPPSRDNDGSRQPSAASPICRADDSTGDVNFTSATSQEAAGSLFRGQFCAQPAVADHGNAAERLGHGNAPHETSVQGAVSSQQGFDAGRSVWDYGAAELLFEARLRDLYHLGEKAIATEIEILRNAKIAYYLKKGLAEDRAVELATEETARWAVNARNSLRLAIRNQGHPIVSMVAKLARGSQDMPTYEQLRAAGKSPEQLVRSAVRSNSNMNRWVGRLRIAGRIMIAVDIGVAAFNIASAPEVDRPKVFWHESSRVAGALGGGWMGAKGGAILCGKIGTIFGPEGAAIGAGVGGVLGGIGGAIGGGWAASNAVDWTFEQFYPPDETHFERSS